jgi:putative Holliday junction resolvase
MPAHASGHSRLFLSPCQTARTNLTNKHYQRITNGHHAMGTVLAFDFGEKRIGVAVGETVLRQAHPLSVIKAQGDAERFAAIARLIEEWRPECLLVGHPVHVDGTAHAMTLRAREFSQRLAARFGLPVQEADERLTSLEAEARLRETGRNAKKMKPLVDAVAAQLILQTWFDHPHDLSSTPLPTEPLPSAFPA